MAMTKVFNSGNSQAVRIPRQFRFRHSKVEIFRKGKDLILRERPEGMEKAVRALMRFSEDFFSGGRRQPKLQKRPAF